MKAVRAVMPVRPTPRPKTALRIGRPAATNEPKVSSSTMRAMPMPMSSEAPPPISWVCEPEPLASTVRPASRAWSMASVRASMVAGSTSATVSTSKVKSDGADPAVRGQRGERVGVGLRLGGRRAALLGGVEDLLRLRLGRLDRVGRAGRPSAICGRAARSADQGVDGLGVRRLVERVALRGGDDDGDRGLVEGVGGAGEQLGLEVGGLLGRDARDGERVAHRLGEAGGDGDDCDEQHQPAGDEERPAPVGGLAESVEQGGHGWASCRWGGWVVGSGEEGAGGR